MLPALFRTAIAATGVVQSKCANRATLAISSPRLVRAASHVHLDAPLAPTPTLARAAKARTTCPAQLATAAAPAALLALRQRAATAAVEATT